MVLAAWPVNTGILHADLSPACQNRDSSQSISAEATLDRPYLRCRMFTCIAPGALPLCNLLACDSGKLVTVQRVSRLEFPSLAGDSS